MAHVMRINSLVFLFSFSKFLYVVCDTNPHRTCLFGVDSGGFVFSNACYTNASDARPSLARSFRDVRLAWSVIRRPQSPPAGGVRLRNERAAEILYPKIAKCDEFFPIGLLYYNGILYTCCFSVVRRCY